MHRILPAVNTGELLPVFNSLVPVPHHAIVSPAKHLFVITHHMHRTLAAVNTAPLRLQLRGNLVPHHRGMVMGEKRVRLHYEIVSPEKNLPG